MAVCVYREWCVTGEIGRDVAPTEQAESRFRLAASKYVGVDGKRGCETCPRREGASAEVRT